MSQSKDIAEILRKRDPEKYKKIIERAALNGYHDHKFDKIPGRPEYGETVCPKIQLVADLEQFPELEDIRQRVKNGEFDDNPDQEDAEEMRSWLMDDGASDQMFKTFGFKPPTEAERFLREKNKRRN